MTKRTNRALIATLLTAAATAAWAQVPLVRPAAVVWHGATSAWYVANLGPGGEASGWITRLDPRDRPAVPRWLTGLKSPRAMAGSGSLLYVADTDEIVEVDASKAAIVARHKIKGARLLAGLAVGSSGEVFASDVLNDTILSLDKDWKPTVLVRGGGLSGPTGLFLDGQELLVASVGQVSQADTLATKGPGHLWAVDLKTRKLRNLAPTLAGRFESIVKLGDSFLVADSAEGAVKRIAASGEIGIVRNSKGCGGLGLDARRKLLAVPEKDTPGDVVFLTLP